MQKNNVIFLLKELIQLGIHDSKILKAIQNIPREHFVEKSLKYKSYENVALPIKFGQFISQPYIVAKMTELLLLKPNSKVLEIGTGSGYQTAILSYLAQHIFSIERIKELQLQAKKKLKKLKLYNISIKYGDGNQGWSTEKPFDAIIITAASKKIPKKLIQQLHNKHGILVAPIGEKNKQFLTRIFRTGKTFKTETIEQVNFVQLIDGV
ncbi:MAG: L-isoaspartate protein carboxylmethyltransferase type II [Candidatus Westeberhardia cardiocondylae]|nr:L-isoaspartate protein carboxylmethyltransferase type II [Candidatus Westeberhardia cardiocondylae]